MKGKKKVERHYLESFLELLGEAYDHIEETERPDFVVSFKGRKVGVEVTEFHSDLVGINGKGRRQIEEERRRLLDNLYNEISKNPVLKGVWVYLMPRELKLLPKSKHKKFIDELIQIVLDMIYRNQEEIEPNERFSVPYQYIKKLRLKKINSLNYFHWDWGDASSVGLAENELIDALQDKIKKAGTYRQPKKIDKLWLLVVSGWRLSQAMPPPEHLKNKLNGFKRLNNLLKISGYSKLYLYQYMFDSIYEYDGCWKQLCH